MEAGLKDLTWGLEKDGLKHFSGFLRSHLMSIHPGPGSLRIYSQFLNTQPEGGCGW